MYSETIGQLARVLFLGALAFVVAISFAPTLIRYLKKLKEKNIITGKIIRDEGKTPIFTELHKKKGGTPVMGGIIIWATVLILAIIFLVLSHFFDGIWKYFNFVNRSQTYLPLAMLILGALLGLADDLMEVFKIGPKGKGLPFKYRLFLYVLISALGALWFFFKLDWNIINVPLLGVFNFSWWYIPIFIGVVTLVAFSANQTNGLDGLAEGVLLFSYLSLGVVSFVQGKYDTTVFIATICGSLSAFLWFNIHPASVFMGGTGIMALGGTLGVLFMYTNTTLLLPFFGFILMIEAISTIIQILSKKIRKKKIFLSAPIHHHFEALGWPEAQITMRFWILSALFCSIGLVIFFIDKFL